MFNQPLSEVRIGRMIYTNANVQGCGLPPEFLLVMLKSRHLVSAAAQSLEDVTFAELLDVSNFCAGLCELADRAEWN